MARALDANQQATLTAFVNHLYELGGFATVSDWATESGYPVSNLYNLRNGKSAIDGYNLLRLIQAVARRTSQAEVQLAVTAARADGAAGDPSNAELGRRLEEVAALVTEGLARLGAGIDRAVREGAGEGHPVPVSEGPR